MTSISEYQRRRRERNSIKFDINDVHDRTCLYFLIAYMLFIFLSVDGEVHPISKWGEYAAIFLGFVISGALAPIFFKHYYHFLYKQCGDSCSESDFRAVLGFCGGVIFLISALFNYLLVLKINSGFDFSTPTVRYVQVKRTEHCLYVVTDWSEPGKTKKISVKREYSTVAGTGEVMRITTRSGALGMEYLYDPGSMKGFPIEEFPEKTTFPITEEEFQKIHINNNDKKDN